MLKKVSKSNGAIQEIGRFRAVREHEFDELIGRIALMIFHSPFEFRVYQDNHKDLNILMRIYEPGEDAFEKEMERYEKGEDLDEKD